MKNLKEIIRKLSSLSMLGIVLFYTGCAEKTPEEIAAENKKNSALAVRRAQVMIFEGKNADAINTLEDASQKYGMGAEISEALAYAYSQDGQFSSAAMCFEKASDLKGGDPQLQISAAKTYEQGGALESAIKAYEKYLKLKPNDAIVWKALASCCNKAKFYQDALKNYLAAIKASGKDPNTLEATEIGSLFLKTGNIHQAQRWLEAAFAATLPENKETRKTILENLIAVYLSQKDMNSVEKAIANADAINKSIVDTVYPELRKQIADFKQKLKEAEETFKIEQKKKEEEAKLAEEKAKTEAIEKAKLEEQEKLKAEEEAKKKDSQKIEEEKAKASEKDSDEETSETIKESESAIQDIVEENVVEEKSTPLQETYKRLEAGDAKLAERSAHIAVADNRTSPEAWTALAKTYEAQNKANDSFLASREALKLNPDDINATLYYLKNASRVQSNEQFLNSLYSAHRKFPNNVEILVGLARTYNVLKDKPNAKYFYAKFLREAIKEHPLYEEMQTEYDALIK